MTVPPCASPLADRVVLVVGCPRSGTTWVERLLLSHPSAGGVEDRETWLFQGLRPLWNNRDLETWADEPTRLSAMRRFCDRMLLRGLDRHRPNATHFVEKTPSHALYLDEISRIYPDAWFIHVVRDGRDVARSLVEFEHGVDDLDTAARLWVRTLDAVRRSAPNLVRHRTVRYEDLLRDPVEGTVSLLSWVGLDVDDEVRSNIRARAAQRVSQYNTSGPVGSGKWRTLPRDDALRIEAIAGSALADHGYELR